MTQPAANLRAGAEALASGLPPLLAAAERLAQGVVPGVHGRRRAGSGETFWQYRQAMPGDTATAIDWRRSGRGDTLFIRETEWEAAQSVQFWVDPAAGMGFASADHPAKSERARLLALALAVLLTRAGERIGLLGSALEIPRAGRNQLARMAMTLADGTRTFIKKRCAPSVGNDKRHAQGRGEEEQCLLSLPMTELIRRADILQKRAIQRKIEREDIMKTTKTKARDDGAIVDENVDGDDGNVEVRSNSSSANDVDCETTVDDADYTEKQHDNEEKKKKVRRKE